MKSTINQIAEEIYNDIINDLLLEGQDIPSSFEELHDYTDANFYLEPYFVDEFSIEVLNKIIDAIDTHLKKH